MAQVLVNYMAALAVGVILMRMDGFTKPSVAMITEMLGIPSKVSLYKSME